LTAELEAGPTSEDELSSTSSLPQYPGTPLAQSSSSVYPHSVESALHVIVAPSLELETSPMLEELASVLSMAEEFVSPAVAALGLLSSQAVSARAKIDAVVSPQAMFVNFVFMKPLLFICNRFCLKGNIHSFLQRVNAFMQQNIDKLLNLMLNLLF
jgi:hypothetical protein